MAGRGWRLIELGRNAAPRRRGDREHDYAKERRGHGAGHYHADYRDKPCSSVTGRGVRSTDPNTAGTRTLIGTTRPRGGYVHQR